MRKNSLLKKTAWIVLSAVLFGTVAGTVMTGVQIASSGMVSQFFAIVSSDEKLPEQREELLPEPFPGGNIPGILPELPVQQFTRCRILDLAGFLEAEASPMKCQAAAPVLLSGKTIQSF